MFDFVHNLWRRGKDSQIRGFSFDRPMLVLQSDDWGRVGVRDKDGYEQLRRAGIRLGENPHDFYTLETEEDVTAVHNMLARHHDSTGRPPCLLMNFLMANLDFPKMAESGFDQIHLLPLTKGLPGKWSRPGLFDAYRDGIAEGVFHPALHGLTHFCAHAAGQALAKGGERANLMRALWKAETPYIHWRMPWVGFEYWNPHRPQAGFLPAEIQAELIREAVKVFRKFFGVDAVSACAPGYRSNSDTHIAWARCGVRVAQNGTGSPLPPHIDEFEVLNLHRTIDFEPFQRGLPLEKYVQLADQCFSHGVPAILSVHSINFHSTLKDFRRTTLQSLDQLFSALERKYPDLLYVHDGDLYDIVMHGKFRGCQDWVSVSAKRPQGKSNSVASGGK